MDITYDNYPLLGFPNTILQDNSGKLPFDIRSTDSISQRNSFKRFILSILEKYSRGNIPVNSYVSDSTLRRINSDTAFSESQFNAFIKAEIVTEFGRILLDKQSICLYLSMSKLDTFAQFNIEGNYFGVAYFKGETLKGFEEVFMTGNGFEKGAEIYLNASDEDKFWKFSMKCLAISRQSKELINLPKIQEKIYKI